MLNLFRSIVFMIFFMGALSCREAEVKTSKKEKKKQELKSSLPEFDECTARLNKLELNKVMDVTIQVPFTQTDSFLQRLIQKSFVLETTRNMPLEVDIKPVSSSFLSYSVWTVFFEGAEFVSPRKGSASECVFSVPQNGDSNRKVVLLDGKSAFDTGFLSQSEVLKKSQSCFSRAFEDPFFISLQSSQEQGAILNVPLSVRLTDNFPGYKTDKAIYSLRLKSNERAYSDIVSFVYVNQGQHLLITPSYAQGCKKSPLTPAQLRQRLQ